MRTQPLKSVFQVKASQSLERFVSDLKVTQPQLFDEMHSEIRKHIILQNEALTRRYADPRVRIVYRLIRAKEERLMAVLLDNRLLEGE